MVTVTESVGGTSAGAPVGGVPCPVAVLTTLAEQSNFRQTGRIEEVERLSREFAATWPEVTRRRVCAWYVCGAGLSGEAPGKRRTPGLELC